MDRKPLKLIGLGLPALAIAVLIAILAAGLWGRPRRDPDIRHRAALGDVVWNHQLHARMKGLDCQTCHHTSKPGAANPATCNSCHHEPPREQQGRVLTDLYPDLTAAPAPSAPGRQPPTAMEAFHGKCVSCHKIVKRGPIACRDCHAQRFSGPHGRVDWNHRRHSRQMDVNCVFCHHTSKGTGQSEVPGCRQCHEGEAVSKTDMSTGIRNHEGATHAGCVTCHKKDDPAAAAPSCVVCHKKIDDDAGPAPIEQAIHQKCFACHHENLKGLVPRSATPNSCSDCHRDDPAYIRTSNGVVMWTHEAHGQEYSCEECHHHPAAPNQPQAACDVCHNDQPGGARVTADMPMSPAADAVHTQCIGCHTQKKAGPVACNSCHAANPDISVFRQESPAGVVMWDHRFHAIGLEFACQECHHNMKARNGVLFTVCKTSDCPPGAGNPQKCVNCHRNPNAPAPPAPEPAGAAWAPIVPGGPELPDAFHATCIGCHQKLAGPTECEQCHTQTKAGE